MKSGVMEEDGGRVQGEETLARWAQLERATSLWATRIGSSSPTAQINAIARTWFSGPRAKIVEGP